jgi:hypothetical protein
MSAGSSATAAMSKDKTNFHNTAVTVLYTCQSSKVVIVTQLWSKTKSREC